jgi:hypothetical protein
VDFLIPWPYPRERVVELSAALGELGFRSATASNGSTYFVHPELKIEFLVPERGKGGLENRLVKSLGVRAIPLRFLDMLLADSIKLREAGIEVRVPKPLNYCLHKLIIAQRRKKADKREKDIQHAVYVLEILEPQEFKSALAALPTKWRNLAGKSLALAWEKLPLERPLLARYMKEPS